MDVELLVRYVSDKIQHFVVDYSVANFLRGRENRRE